MEKGLDVNINQSEIIVFYFFRNRIFSFFSQCKDQYKLQKLIQKIDSKGEAKWADSRRHSSKFSKSNTIQNAKYKDNLIVVPIENSMNRRYSKPMSKVSNPTNYRSNGYKYIVIGGYPDLEKCLEERGFIKQEDQESQDFDFKFSINTKLCNWDTLKPHQVVNHFYKNGAVTRKVELMRNLRLMIYKGFDIDRFFPRAYDLSEKVDFEDFIDDYKITKCMSILKLHLIQNEEQRAQNLSNLNYLNRIKLAMKILYSRFDLLSDYKNLTKNAQNACSISDSEWEVLAYDENYSAYLKEIDKIRKFYKNHIVVFGKRKESSYNIDNVLSKLNDNSLESKYLNINKEIEILLNKLRTIYPQFNLNGNENIWILKPSGLSRGRGISIIKSLDPALKHIKYSSQYVIQKYIENPVIIKQRKFDIRQWVMITSVNPLHLWKYQEPYVRFSAYDYSTENLEDNLAHLTNNSIAKYSNEDKENMKIKGNMCTIEEFKAHLIDVFKRDVWNEIEQKITRLLILSIYCAKGIIVHREKSFEVLGFDIMLDTDLNAWLIEANSSPDMSYSTHITEKIVKEGIRDMMKVLFDYPKDNKADTGKWKLIYTGEQITPDFKVN